MTELLGLNPTEMISVTKMNIIIMNYKIIELAMPNIT